MGLIGNGSVLLKSPGRSLGGVAHATYRPGWGQAGANQNQFMAFSMLSGTPSGYRPPYSWGLAIKDGQLSSFTLIGGTAALSAAAAGGRNAEAALSGTGTLTGVGALIVSAVAALTGTGSLSANAVAYLNAAAALSGSGDLTGAVKALGEAVAAIQGTGSTTATARATGTLAASVLVAAGAELSPDAIASAVWSSPQGEFLYAVAHNRVITDPDAGTYTVYAADDTTVLFTADLWQDADGTVPYAGAGADRRDRLT